MKVIRYAMRSDPQKDGTTMRLPITLLLALSLHSAAHAVDAELAFDSSSFDRTVDVCDDPYAYVNNTWLRETEIPADLPMWGPIYAVRQRNQDMQRELAERAAKDVSRGIAKGDAALVGAFYAAGLDQKRIDEAGVAPIALELSRIDRIRTREDVAAFLAEQSGKGVDLAFSYYVWPRGDDPTRHIIFVEQGGLGMDERSFYVENDVETTKKRSAYRAHLAKLVELSGVAAAAAEREADAALALERALARASFPTEELTNVNNLYAVRSIDEAERLAPHLDWSRFFAAHGHRKIREINLAQPEFFAELDRRLAETPVQDWRAYLKARLLEQAAPYLAEPFAAQHAQFHDTVMRGSPAHPPRWKSVLRALDRLAFAPMSKLYVETYLPPDVKPRALAMVADLRAAFRARIENRDWLSQEGKRAALEKLDRMGAKIGYPDRWPDLSELRFDRHDYFGNVRAAQRFAVQQLDRKLARPVDPAEWFNPAHEVNARYDHQKNEIIFPAPMLLPPGFDPKLDPALNYAVLGVVIGHEMTHGFDDFGAKFDPAGRLRDWWTDEDKRRFAERGGRIAERYSAFEPAEGKHVNGKQTLAENTADLGGLAIAYDALMLAEKREPQSRINGLTQAQHFFLRYNTIWRNEIRPEFADLLLKTDWHAPSRFRALGPTADMPEFSQAFDCKPGDAMYVEKSTSIGIW